MLFKNEYIYKKKKIKLLFFLYCTRMLIKWPTDLLFSTKTNKNFKRQKNAFYKSIEIAQNPGRVQILHLR